MRNFVCPVTEALCDHGGCKKDILCIIERDNEARRREADAPCLLAARAEEADIASMMLAIAKKDILDAYRKKHGKGFDKGDEALADAAKLLLRRSDYAEGARDTAVELVKSIKEGAAKMVAAGALSL